MQTTLPRVSPRVPLTDVRQWYMQNGLQLNPDKSEALIVGTSSQLTSTSAMSSVSVAGVDAGGGRDEGTRRGAGSSSVVRPSRDIGGKGVQLPRPGHPITAYSNTCLSRP